LIEIVPGNKKLETADTVTICDIWRENFSFFKNKLTWVKLDCTPGKKETAPLRKNRLQKKETIKKEPIEETTKTFSDRKPAIVEQHVVASGGVVLEKKGKVVLERKDKILEDDVFFYASKCSKDWNAEEIHDAFRIYNNSKYEISDPLKYIEGIINKKRVTKQNREYQCKKKKTSTTLSSSKKACQTEDLSKTKSLTNSSEIPKSECSENVTEEPAVPKLNLREKMISWGLL
jgi:hypothetical protein